MKIHTLASPPTGMTYATVTIDTVELLEGGQARFRFTLGGAVATLIVDYSTWPELPVPGMDVNLTLWRQT